MRCADCDQVIAPPELFEKVARLFEEKGADVWFEAEVADLMPQGVTCPKCNGSSIVKETDILDVWFDSGVSWAAVCEQRKGLDYPCQLYLEGSDQHRGWFHSALLTSVGTRGRAPYGNVLTHGFVVDGQGKKMSKSLGNVIQPQEIIDKYGADILRLWVSAEDYRDDIRISPEILERLSEAYRRIRNTCRFLLGNLADFNPQEHMIEPSEMRQLDRFALERLNRITQRVRTAYEDFEFHVVFHTLYNYCTVDLSSLYLDILKDRLYVEKTDGAMRRSAQTALYHILSALVRLMAPILSFTSEEVWSLFGKEGGGASSLHLASFPEPIPGVEMTDLERSRWEKMLALRQEVSKALEEARAAKLIGSSLEAKVFIEAPQAVAEAMSQIEDLEGFFIVSELEVKTVTIPAEETQVEGPLAGVRVTVARSEGDKCPRCWMWTSDVGSAEDYPDVCLRCAGVLRESSIKTG
jgi:isoleucyl-tRNA synthetase